MASEAEALEVRSLIVDRGLDPTRIVGVAVESDVELGYIVRVFLAREEVPTPPEICGVPIRRRVIGMMRPL